MEKVIDLIRMVNRIRGKYMDKSKTKALKNVAVIILCAIITTIGIILVENKSYVTGILFIDIGVILFAKLMKVGKGKITWPFKKSKSRRKGLLLNGTLRNVFGNTKPFPIKVDIIQETQSEYEIDMGYWNGGTYWVKKDRVKIIGK